jgi:phenylglyoxylate dehydrogenase epsilon subunit
MLEGSGIEVNHGILVDKWMRTNAEEIFAAGDVAEAPDFFSGRNGLSPISPSAVDQGKIAGSTMVGEAAEYNGWLSMNLYNFFGHLAVSMGQFTQLDGNEAFIDKDDGKRSYRKIVCRDNLLVGASFFNIELDAGVMQYLIRNKIDIGPYKESLLEKPKEVSLWLMLEAEKKNTTSLEG